MEPVAEEILRPKGRALIYGPGHKATVLEQVGLEDRYDRTLRLDPEVIRASSCWEKGPNLMASHAVVPAVDLPRVMSCGASRE